MERNKNHVLETKAKKKKINKAEEFRLIQRKQNIDICRQKVELDGLIKAINETNLKVEELKFQIANLRKRKVAHDKQLNKLSSKNEELKINVQVQRLIRQATSHENLSQSYIGWCPFS